MLIIVKFVDIDAQVYEKQTENLSLFIYLKKNNIYHYGFKKTEQKVKVKILKINLKKLKLKL